MNPGEIITAWTLSRSDTDGILADLAEHGWYLVRADSTAYREPDSATRPARHQEHLRIVVWGKDILVSGQFYVHDQVLGRAIHPEGDVANARRRMVANLGIKLADELGLVVSA